VWLVGHASPPRRTPRRRVVIREAATRRWFAVRPKRDGGVPLTGFYVQDEDAVRLRVPGPATSQGGSDGHSVWHRGAEGPVSGGGA